MAVCLHTMKHTHIPFPPDHHAAPAELPLSSLPGSLGGCGSVGLTRLDATRAEASMLAAHQLGHRTLQTDLLTDCGTVHCGGERGDLLLQPPELQLHAIDAPA